MLPSTQLASQLYAELLRDLMKVVRYKQNIRVEDHAKHVFSLIEKFFCYVKKNPFDRANETIQKLKLSVSENTACRRLQLSGLLIF